jgi:hypothetical protein
MRWKKRRQKLDHMISFHLIAYSFVFDVLVGFGIMTAQFYFNNFPKEDIFRERCSILV